MEPSVEPAVEKEVDKFNRFIIHIDMDCYYA